jgi:hypothetical protein
MIKILNRYTEEVIIQGEHETIKELIEANFAADLREADLSGAYLRDSDLRDSDLWDSDLRGSNLRDADLRGSNLRDADLWGTDLGGAKILASQKDDLLSALGVVVEEDSDES